MSQKNRKPCPCGHDAQFATCCEPFIKEKTAPKTAEALMRSRYSAYATGAIDYIIKTTHPSYMNPEYAQAIKDWVKVVTSWDKLVILSTKDGLEKDTIGLVEFIAYYHQLGQAKTLHERSRFSKISGKWVYEEGQYDGL